MNTLVIFSVLGIFGGVLCAVGDILFDLKGPGNQKLGTSKNIDSNWSKMSDWRFGASILCAYIGDCCVALGILSLAYRMYDRSPVLAYITGICGVAGSIGGFFVHTLVCLQALIYKGITEKSTFEAADYTLEKIYRQVMVTFFLAYAILMIPCVCSVIAILNGTLDVPVWCVLLNSIVFLIIGVALRKIDPKRFQDLPGIVMPSLGLSMIGVIGLIDLLQGSL
ncbi:MAG: hypothetical protein IJT87_05395 [Ruminiclostridium sp.]|nr:hypothetical protein [Ruminiclostridium sp.]